MKKLSFLSLLVSCLILSFSSYAQVSSPQPSPSAKVTQTIGLTEITVSYSRPGVKGREIFGKLVPYGEMWRTGANHCTVIEASADFKLAGNEIPAGKYGLFTIPTKGDWTIVVSNQNDIWGTGGYDQSKDVVRFKVDSKQMSSKVESFTIDFSDFTDNSATMSLMWDKTGVDIPVSVETDAVIMAQIDKNIINGGPSASSYFNAANFYRKKGKDLDQALSWMNKAIEMNPKAFWYIHQKAKLLAEMGKKKDAIKTAEESIEIAKKNEGGDFGYIARNEEFIAELKKK